MKGKEQMRAVDADELKKGFVKLCESINADNGITIPTLAFIRLIDNAPTVEPQKVLVANVTFDKDELEQLVRDRVIEPIKNGELIRKEDRSQGEWVKVKEERMSIDMSGEIATRYKCSECGRMITILPSKLADYPFCHCGADMRGDNNDKTN